jgi:hypothetical protein
MAQLVLGIGMSHTPMLNAPAEDWPRFVDRDGVRDFLDKEGQPATYQELLRRVEPHVAAELTPERFAARHAEAQAGVDHLKAALRRAEVDALIVVGDDHKEIYHNDNMPALVVYYGKTIRNIPLNGFSGPDWARRATARYYEEREPREYPVESGPRASPINSLLDQEFDIVASNASQTWVSMTIIRHPALSSCRKDPTVFPLKNKTAEPENSRHAGIPIASSMGYDPSPISVLAQSR